MSQIYIGKDKLSKAFIGGQEYTKIYQGPNLIWTSHTHNYALTKSVASTCTTRGYNTYTCECGDSYKVYQPLSSHKYLNGYCTDCGSADPNWSPNYYTVSITCHYSTALEDTWCDDCYVSLEYFNPYSDIGWDDFSDTYNFGETKQIDLPEGTKLGLVIEPGSGQGSHYYDVVINNNWSFDLDTYSLYDNLDIHIYVQD